MYQMIEKISDIFHLSISEMVNSNKFIINNNNNSSSNNNNNNEKKNTIKSNKKQSNTNFNTIIFDIITFPVRKFFELMYYIYITVPLEFISRFYTYILTIIQSIIKSIFLVFNKRSTNNEEYINNHYHNYNVQKLRRGIKHAVALCDVLAYISHSIYNTKLSILCIIIIQTFYEIFVSWYHQYFGNGYNNDNDTNISIKEFADDLISYEDIITEESTPAEILIQKRMKRTMHNYVPPTPFRVEVKIYPDINNNNNNNDGIKSLDESLLLDDYLFVDSPSSFPSSPYSLSLVKNKTSDRIDSIMFTVRDKLRIEEQIISKDEYSRFSANKARNNGLSASFNPKQSSDDIHLICGNHCAVKFGSKELCCSSRSMIPLSRNKFVYLEFSVTVTGNITPSICLGLSTDNSPLNVMVGSNMHSLGLYSDGHLLIESHWFKSTSNCKITTGSTVGFLVYLNDNTFNDSNQNYVNNSNGDFIEKLFGFNNFEYSSDKNDISEDGEINSNNNNNNNNIDLLQDIDSSDLFQFNININGISQEFSSIVTENVSKISNNNSNIYPTVSILSDETRVWCRFCEADVIYKSRETIGAPPGVRVYCLDGTLLIDEFS